MSEVLNLEFYENISNQAKETSRQLNENLNKNNALLSLRKEDLLNPKEISKSLKNKRQQLTEIEDEIANLKQNMLDLQNQKTKLSVIEQKKITNLSLIQTNEKDIESLNDQVENWNKESIKFQKILQRRPLGAQNGGPKKCSDTQQRSCTSEAGLLHIISLASFTFSKLQTTFSEHVSPQAPKATRSRPCQNSGHSGLRKLVEMNLEWKM